jgi:hypothetical protein
MDEALELDMLPMASMHHYSSEMARMRMRSDPGAIGLEKSPSVSTPGHGSVDLQSARIARILDNRVAFLRKHGMIAYWILEISNDSRSLQLRARVI